MHPVIFRDVAAVHNAAFDEQRLAVGRDQNKHAAILLGFGEVHFINCHAGACQRFCLYFLQVTTVPFFTGQGLH